MKITIKGTAKEIADLVSDVQGRQSGEATEVEKLLLMERNEALKRWKAAQSKAASDPLFET